MTREQIERTSVTIKESQNYHMSFEDAQDYISKCGFDIPWNDGDVFVDEREITRTVGNVLKWRINSVWHDASEKPKFGATKGVWIVRYFEHGMLSTTFVRKDEWYELRKSNNFTKWAYQEDLFPERKEDKQ